MDWRAARVQTRFDLQGDRGMLRAMENAAYAPLEAGEFDLTQRRYAPFVNVLRRHHRGAGCAPAETTLEETRAWLLRDGLRHEDFAMLYEELVWRIIASGAPISRATVHVGTLHPQLSGYSWNFELYDGFVDEIIVAREASAMPSFKLNPLNRVFNHGETVRVAPQDPDDARRFPLMAELAEQGVTDYIARPLGGGSDYNNGGTIATRQPGGFTDAQYRSLTEIFDLFALFIERHIAQQISANVLDTYLGASAGAEVLAGAIERGAGRRIEAIIWVSDLRGFTDRSERMSEEEVSMMLNLYFGALAGAVMAEGGEVLKFIGDGLLAVFPVGGDARCAARRALAAAEASAAEVAELNDAPPEELPRASLPLKTGVALHRGEVFFGNVGSPSRLDFTVIGRAVNEASRVETLTKEVGQSLLVTRPVADLLDRQMQAIGAFSLKGVEEPVEVFAPLGAAAAASLG